MSEGTSGSVASKRKRVDDDDEPTAYEPSDGKLALFSTVYYAAVNDVSNVQVNSLLHLQRLNGVKCSFVDICDDS